MSRLRVDREALPAVVVVLCKHTSEEREEADEGMSARLMLLCTSAIPVMNTQELVESRAMPLGEENSPEREPYLPHFRT